MVITNSEYYLLNIGGGLEHHDPNFDLDWALWLDEPIDMPEQPIDLYVRPPISMFSMGDYLGLFGGIKYVVSERIKSVIVGMQTIKMQFLPACIHKGKKDYDSYFILKCYNEILCMDKTNSFWTKSSNINREKEVLSIEKLVIDDAQIKDIPVSERLIFRVKECTPYILFHTSIVEEFRKLKKLKGHNFVLVPDNRYLYL